MSYAAEYRTKAGTLLARVFGETREVAAGIIFRTYPKAKTATTSRAYLDSHGSLASSCSDIRWINRRDLES